jgi:tungstate transport system ATP-binding protein
MIERFKLGRVLDKNAKALSTGETQRTSLARALLCRPKLLLLDEPTANVDPECVADVEDEILRQNGAGVTVIIATHITGLAYRIPSGIIRLEKGKVTEPEINNVFSGELIHKGQECFVEVAPSLRFACVTEKFGDVRAAIPATDIVVSLQHIDSSMRNQFEATVKEIRQIEDIVELSVDIGVVVKAAITPASLKEMKIEPKSKVFISFKATAVKVF